MGSLTNSHLLKKSESGKGGGGGLTTKTRVELCGTMEGLDEYMCKRSWGGRTSEQCRGYKTIKKERLMLQSSFVPALGGEGKKGVRGETHDA